MIQPPKSSKNIGELKYTTKVLHGSCKPGCKPGLLGKGNASEMYCTVPCLASMQNSANRMTLQFRCMTYTRSNLDKDVGFLGDGFT